MRHLLLALMVILGAACESNKESLPGSYKLEKSDVEKEEAQNYYSLKNFSVSEDKASYGFIVSAYKSWDKDLYKGTLSLTPFTKDKKSFMTFKINIDDSEISRTEPFVREPGKIQQLESTYKDLRVDCAFVCRDTECKTIAFSTRFTRDSRDFKYASGLFVSVWNMEEKEGAYKITTIFNIEGDQELYFEMYKDPLYILKLPSDSPNLKKWQSF